MGDAGEEGGEGVEEEGEDVDGEVGDEDMPGVDGAALGEIGLVL